MEYLPYDIFTDQYSYLRNDSKVVNKKSFAIMEWWRLNTDTISTYIGTYRFRAFGSWQKLIILILLCVPSSSVVESVFSLLNQKIKVRCYT